MKKVLILMVIAAASVAAAHSTGWASTSSPSTPAQAAPGSQAPAAQKPAQAAPSQGRTPPQAKSQEEFKAYQEAFSKTTPADTEAAADAFAAKYPDSELRPLLYRKAMFEYQNANDAEKTVAMARKLLAIDPDSPEALVTVATITAQSTRETDLDRDERLNEAVKDANKALETVNTDYPANTPQDRLILYQNSIRGMAYDALGTVAMGKKDYAAAEANLRKSAEFNPQPDPVTYLRLSLVLDQQMKYAQALEAANKAVQYSADAPQANNLAKRERDRLQKLVNAGGTPAPAATPAPTAPAPTSPTPSTPTTPSKPPQ